MPFPNKRGITLAATVLLILFASITTFGVTVFIVQRLSQTSVKQFTLRARYLAQAGIHQAVYQFRFRRAATGVGSFSLGATAVDAQNAFEVGGDDADFVMVDASEAMLAGTDSDTVSNLTLQNANDTVAVTIDRILVAWGDAPRRRRLREIWINGMRVWRGDQSSPVNANIRDFALDATPSIYPGHYFRFNNNISAVSHIDATYVMRDGSSRTLRVFPASNELNFVVKASGQTGQSVIYKTVAARYNAVTGTIEDYKEIDEQILP